MRTLISLLFVIFIHTTLRKVFVHDALLLSHFIIGLVILGIVFINAGSVVKH